MSDFYEEACYLSNSEAEPDSETEDSVAKPAAVKPELVWDDPQALLNTWLGELDNLHMVSHDMLPVFLLLLLLTGFGPYLALVLTGFRHRVLWIMN